MILVEDFPGDPTFADQPSMGIPGVFVFFFVLVLAIGIGGTIWRVTAARDMARRSGLDADEATAMTLLSDHGLEATYLASHIEPHLRPGQPAAQSQTPKPAAERLAELASLRDSGAITEAEYAERRKAVIDSV
ncbi:MAG: SHOCT domain-containing protein [Nocardioidaceae bacterium]|nr:SHOCT domain-containing protein [Nocardioidaceae bacterium]